MTSREPFIRHTGVAAAWALGFLLAAGCRDPLEVLPGECRTESEPLRVSDIHPNIILIVADDLGYGDLSIYGSDIIDTPSIDALAQSGVMHTDFYVTASVCTPSRASLLTGRYHVRAGLVKVLNPQDKGGLPKFEVTIAETLRRAGYATGIIGKWHLGHSREFMPWNQGFDYFFGLPYSNDMTPLPLYRNQDVIAQDPDQATLIERYTEEAIAFIERNQESRFFLYLPHNAPHVPLQVPSRFRGTSAGGLYGDVVQALDWSVGEVVGAIDRLNLRDKTLIILKTTHDENQKGTSPAHLMRHDVIEDAFNTGEIERIEFYGPAQDWHLRWTDDVRVIYHLNYYRSPLVSHLHRLTRQAMMS